MSRQGAFRWPLSLSPPLVDGPSIASLHRVDTVADATARSHRHERRPQHHPHFARDARAGAAATAATPNAGPGPATHGCARTARAAPRRGRPPRHRPRRAGKGRRHRPRARRPDAGSMGAGTGAAEPSAGGEPSTFPLLPATPSRRPPPDRPPPPRPTARTRLRPHARHAALRPRVRTPCRREVRGLRQAARRPAAQGAHARVRQGRDGPRSRAQGHRRRVSGATTRSSSSAPSALAARLRREPGRTRHGPLPHVRHRLRAARARR